MSPPTRARWIDRVLGVAVGSLVTAWWMGRSAPDDTTASSAEVVASSAVRPAEETIPVATAPEAAVGDLRSSNPVPPTERPPDAAPTTEATPVAAVAADVATNGTSPSSARTRASASREIDEPPATAAPTLPLPRMPGDTRLSSSSRFDDANEAWILKAAFRVHARDHHVIGFYRKALADQGLVVTQSEDPPNEDGAVKTYLHGKSSRVHAQVGILPRTGALETRVWILWRTRE